MLDELIRTVGPDHVASPVPAQYLTDATARGLHGSALAVVRPADAAEAARVVEACYRNDIAITPRGGGSGVAGARCPTAAS
jgi:FAD/FMN-containing dehydrogenase